MSRRDGLASALLGLIIAASLTVSAWFYVRIQQVNQDISCAAAEYNIEQLIALAAVSRELGIPRTFEIPDLPPECAAP